MERAESNIKNYFVTKEHGTTHKTVKVCMKNLLSTGLRMIKYTSNTSENKDISILA